MDEMQIVRRYLDSVPVDVPGLLAELGVAYIEEPMGEGNSGRIDYDGLFWTVTVNSDESAQRRRFTAAHELGHYLMHRDLIATRGHLDRLFGGAASPNPAAPLSPRHEVQANQFAADLLMPRGIIREHYEAGPPDNHRQLAAMLGVSPAAMEIRLQSMGLRRLDTA